MNFNNDPLTAEVLRDLFPLAELPDRLPRRRGKKVHLNTVRRWAFQGRHGRRLRTRRLGGTIWTSLRWAEEFFDSLDSPIADAPSATLTARHQKQAERERARLHRELDAMGL